MASAWVGAKTNRTEIEKWSDRVHLRLTAFVLRLASLIGICDLPPDDKTLERWWRKPILVTIYLTYLYCSIKLSISLWFSYKHDQLVYSYKRFCRLNQCDESESSCGADPNRCSLVVRPQLIKYLEAIKQARLEAKQIGAPYLHLCYTSEIVYWVILIASFYTVVVTRLYHRFFEKVDSELINIYLDPLAGQQRVNDMIEQVTQRCVPNQRLMKYCCLAQNNTIPASISRDLKRMTISGDLLPFNRKQNMILGLSRLFSFTILSSLSFLTIVGTIALLGMMRSNMSLHWETNLMDLLMLVDVALLIIILTIIITVYLAMSLINLTDQIVTAQGLIRMQKECIATNRQLMMEQKRSKGVVDTNQNLLQFFVFYRMFVVQASKTIPLMGTYLFFMAQVISYGPLLIYLHAAYMDPSLISLALVTMLGALVVLAFIWMPSCYLYSRCEDLCQSLFSLMAHIQSDDGQYQFYDSDLVELIFKELQDPIKMLDQFAICRFGIKFNYANMLTFYFWHGIFLISVYFSRWRQNPDLELLSIF